jgi:dolichyl-phosphate-mannose-protein mannosyltransferase
MLAPDASVVEDERKIRVVKFEPTDAATEPAPASSENEGGKVHSTGTRTSGTEDEGVPEVIENLEEVKAFGVGEDTDNSRMSHGPLDHEEAIADQVAYGCQGR